MTLRPMIALIVLAGCASAPPPLSPREEAMRTSSPILCYLNYAAPPEYQSIARAELERRAFACKEQDIRDGSQHLQQIRAEQAQMAAQRAADRSRRADAALGLGALLLQAQPPAPLPARPIVCNTTPDGRTTVCN